MDGVVRAVDGVSFSIGAGQTLGIVGESGCGKSVTALSIMRLHDTPPTWIPTDANAAQIPESVGGCSAMRRRATSSSRAATCWSLPEDEMRAVRGNDIAMIFQEPMTSLNPVFTVGEQIAEAVMHHTKASKKDAWVKAVDSLRAVGINNPERRVKQYPHEMSGGMRQRVMIAMALSCDPKLLIADEPTTALDVTIQAQILELIREVQDRTGAALMLITHDLGVVAETVHDVVVMYAGRVVETGTRRTRSCSRRSIPTPRACSPPSRRAACEASGSTSSREPCRIRSTCPRAATSPRAARTPSGPAPSTIRRIEEADPADVACWLYTPTVGSPVPPRPRRPTDRERPHDRGAHRRRRPPPERRPAMTREPLVTVTNLVKYYPIYGGFLRRKLGDVKAVDDVSFEVQRGEVFGLVGESGCGKSTLGKTLIRLQPETAGERHDRRRGHLLQEGRRPEAASPADADHLPGPGRLAEPADAHLATSSARA